MNTVANLSPIEPSRDVYDPDEVVPRDSPLLQPRRSVNLRLSPSPPPPIPLSQVSPPPSPGRRKSNRRQKVRASQGDAVLISFMDGGKNPLIAATAGTEALPSDISEDSHETEEESETGSSEDLYQEEEAEDEQAGEDEEIPPVEDMSVEPTTTRQTRSARAASMKAMAALVSHGNARKEANGNKMPVVGDGEPQPPNGSAANQPREDNHFTALKSLAAGALGALNLNGPEPEGGDTAGQPPADVEPQAIPDDAQPPPEQPQVVSVPREMLARDDRSAGAGAPSPYSPDPVFSPGLQGLSPIHHVDPRSPGALPPIQGMGSPRSDTNGNLLPSIREQLGDINTFGDPVPDKRRVPGYHHSGQQGILRMAHMNQASPPISPNDTFRRGDLPSPGHPLGPVTSPYYHPGVNGYPRSADYNSSTTTETPSTDHSGSTPATSTSVTDRMSIDGLTHPLVGVFVCKVPGCSAPPFQTQYLLNSHANVHSSARPHYCPVQGCPRSEGGKGFKRKNEMIRHGLVHDSPGYVCPFCPDREHRYPRPDNLQRHVRVHHMDKDKDDPMLRDVLSQRPDGPNRGRRRRGVSAHFPPP